MAALPSAEALAALGPPALVSAGRWPDVRTHLVYARQYNVERMPSPLTKRP
ncbi:hypothetical protein [Sphaerisporangium sp. NPDC051011]|uniref:hypothetical protein n=1 Tax=Sphaerisporangium sp. NPDC051011 TaxID=3155792 RepID=UPI0033C8C117